MLKQLVEAILPGASRLEAQLTEAEKDLQTKRLALNNLLIESGADGPAAAKASDAVDSAERRVKHLQGALAAAQERQRVSEVQTKQDAKRAAWQGAVKAAEERHAAIMTLAKSMAAFAADYNAVLKINEALLAALPENCDAYANMTDRWSLETALRKELVRLGLDFAFSWPYGAVSLPPLLPQFDGALNVIKASVPADLR
jgi:hypothetical protein